MVGTTILMAFSSIVGLVTFFLPTVTELPFSIGEAVSMFAGTVRSLVTHMPFLEVILNLFLLGLVIKTALLMWGWVQWLLSLFRG